MKKYIISFASNGYYAMQDMLMTSIKSKNSVKYYYTDKWLRNQQFYNENIRTLSQKRGAGYWLWKPFIIKETLNKMKDGDLLFYSDVDAICISNLDPLFALCKEHNILLFQNTEKKNRDWTKRDCFILMDADNANFYDSYQVNAAFLFLKKTKFTVSFVDEWLRYSTDERILTDKENTMGKPNLSSYIGHRHDQSILGILAKKYSLTLFRDPSEYGNPYKIEEYRVAGEYLENDCYETLQMYNSQYNTLLSFSFVGADNKNRFRKLIRKIKHLKPYI